MLGRFLIPLAKLDELDDFVDLFGDVGGLKLAVLGSGGDTDEDYVNNIRKDIVKINYYRKKQS